MTVQVIVRLALTKLSVLFVINKVFFHIITKENVINIVHKVHTKQMEFVNLVLNHVHHV